MFKKAFFIAFLSLFLLRCNNTLNILAPYKEGVSVYGLLNQNDTVQYIRIERIFEGAGNAITMAQNPDSVYFKPGRLKVTLTRIKDGVQVSVDNPASSAMEIVLTETYLQLQTGVFSPNQMLYKTNHPLYDDSQYNLIMHDNKTGKDFSINAPIGLIGDFKSQLTYGQDYSVLTPNQSPSQINTINIVPSHGTVVCKFGSPVNSGVCGLTARFYYTEYPAAVSKYVDLGLGYQYVGSSSGGQLIDLSFSGDGMMNDIADAIKVDPNVDHRTADSVYFLLTGGGPDLSLYNQVNGTTSLSQTKPTYSNIRKGDGVGVFSSRKEFDLVKKFTTTPNGCTYRLANDPITCHLHFYHNGALGTNACP